MKSKADSRSETKRLIVRPLAPADVWNHSRRWIEKTAAPVSGTRRPAPACFSAGVRWQQWRRNTNKLHGGRDRHVGCDPAHSTGSSHDPVVNGVGRANVS